MSCQWIGGCNVPTPDGTKFCTGHGKMMGVEKPPKKAYIIPKVSAKKKISDKLSKPDKEALDKFFDDALLNAPFHCENCKADLRESTIVHERAIVCHILPKKKGFGGFPSVAANPINKFYGCNACHCGYDQQGESFILSMPLLPTIKQRVSLLIPFLSTAEVNKIPEYLL